MSPLFLAVDAGNTKTEAAVVDAAPQVHGRGRGGRGDIYGDAGEDAAVEVVRQAVCQALDQAGVTAAEVDHAAFRLAGVDWPEDEALWREQIERLWPGLDCSVMNDGHIYDHIAHPSGHGVSIVLGTGGAVAGRGPDGEFALSFWIQHPLGASGLVWQSLRAASLAELGLAPATALTTLLPELMDQPSVGECLRAVHGRNGAWSHPRLAGLAPRITALSTSDGVVRGLVEEQAQALAGYARVVQQRCRIPDPLPVALGGGMVIGAPHVGDSVEAALRLEIPGCQVVTSAGSALYGAAVSALAEAGHLLSDEPRARLRAMLS